MRLLAHALKHMPEPLLKALDADESISLVSSVSESESIDIHKNLSVTNIFPLILIILVKFFGDNYNSPNCAKTLQSHWYFEFKMIT